MRSVFSGRVQKQGVSTTLPSASQKVEGFSFPPALRHKLKVRRQQLSQFPAPARESIRNQNREKLAKAKAQASRITDRGQHIDQTLAFRLQDLEILVNG